MGREKSEEGNERERLALMSEINCIEKNKDLEGI